jgi:predicted PurR-regulated permease PerM
MKQRSDIYRQYLIWGLSGPILFLNFWVLGQLFQYFEQAITIVTVSAILGLLLSYPVRWLEKHHIPRIVATLLVLIVVVSLVVLLGFTVVPLVIEQATQLLNAFPEWVDKLTAQFSWVQQLALRYNFRIELDKFFTQLEQIAQTMVSWLPGLAIGTLGRLFDTILVIVLAIYMLLYGQQMWGGLIDLLPVPLGPAFDKSLQFNVQQFLITQFLLALVMMLGLIPLFVLLKVKFALLFALIIGIFELIPFIGAALGILLVTLLTLLQGFWLSVWVALTAIALQQVKDNLIAPRLLGQFIGLNPIWIFVALLLGARIAGILGVLLAIPIAGTLKGTIEQLRTQSSPIITHSSENATPSNAVE